ncbi:restriction endonuclease subunit S [Lutispora sp.]|uniref:restriction endonuclease subunit S n=1 Tax=Lutispora sp. TaxID=2828727 RepID=UPI002B1F8CAC|nr:restriction endonuclease subunit S [Lutispora sp.]MEA4964154.1 restriction endonuclease subunit S [Lutispora sp.]
MSKWKLVKLGEVCEFIRNGASIKQGKNRNGYPITRIETISNCIVDRNKMGYAGIGELGKYKEYVLNSGDILMSHINSEKHLGKVAYYENRNEETIIHGMNLLCLRLKQQKVRYKYVFYFLNSSFFRRQIPNITKKSVNQASFTVTALKELIMILPPLDIQKHIADTLYKTNEIIDCQKKQIEELDNLIKATFYDMFGDPVTNEKGWKLAKIKDLAKKIQYGTSEKATTEILEYAILRMNNITYNGEWDFGDLKYINLSSADKEKYLVHKGEMLFNRTNSKELVGKSAAYRNEYPMAYAGYLVKLTPNERTNSEFISAFLNSKYGKALLKSMAKNIIGMANINAKELGNIKIYVPPLDLQNKFAQIVTNIEQQKSLVRQSITESQNLFNSLMSKYFD